MMRYYITTIGLVFLFLFSNCSSSNQAVTTDSEKDSVKTTNASIPLSDYLKRVPGITVNGSGGNTQINVRGAMSMHGNTSPLFVVDGTRYGRDFSRIQDIPVTTIDSVKVLKGIDASSAYGMEGAAGVILITTKKNA